MSATTASLRYLWNRLYYGDDKEQVPDRVTPVQTNLEKFGKAMRYAFGTVQYYSPEYDYRRVVSAHNESAKLELENGK